MDDQEWLEGQLETVAEVGGAQFDFDLYLSTDGKHSVHISAETQMGRRAGIKYAVSVYDRLIQRFGTKQSQTIKEYSKPPNGDTESPAWCKEHQVTMKQYEKNGKTWFAHKNGESWCNPGRK